MRPSLLWAALDAGTSTAGSRRVVCTGKSSTKPVNIMMKAPITMPQYSNFCR